MEVFTDHFQDLIRDLLPIAKLDNKGITFIEILLVVVVLSVLVAIILVRFGRFTDKAREKTTIKNLKSIKVAIDVICSHQDYPTTKEDAEVLFKEIKRRYFVSNFPKAKLRKSINNLNIDVETNRIVFISVDDDNNDGITTLLEIVDDIEEQDGKGGWAYIYQDNATKSKMIGEVVINCSKYTTDGERKYCEIRSY